jgi:hypothetical protein
MSALQTQQKRLSKISNQERVIQSQESTRDFLVTIKKKFSYEYDLSTEGILKSLIGKSYTTPKDYQRLFDALIQKTYETNKGKGLKF